MPQASSTADAAPRPAPDFPAAHSMDTSWFAVDGEGNVGQFATDQEGVVPWRAPRAAQVFAVAQGPKGEELLTGEHDFDDLTEWNEWYLQRQLLWAMPEQVLLNASIEDLDAHRSRVEYYRQHLENMEWQARKNPHREPMWSVIDEQLMFLTSPDPVLSYVAKGLARVKTLSDFSGRLPASADDRLGEWLSDPRWQRDAVAVYFLSVEVADWVKFEESGCLWSWTPRCDPDMACLGVYYYESHDRGDPFVPAWRRLQDPPIDQHAPNCALHVDQLPGSIRPFMEAVRFGDISFRSAEPIIVGDYEPCYRYGEPICVEYDATANLLCCTLPESLVNERADGMVRRAREEASRWGYRFEGPTSSASREAQQRNLRLRRHWSERA